MTNYQDQPMWDGKIIRNYLALSLIQAFGEIPILNHCEENGIDPHEIRELDTLAIVHKLI